MANIVHCRLCHAEIDKAKSIEGVDWIMPSKNFYYHPTCYQEWKGKKNDIYATAEDKVWFESLKEYLAKDLRMQVNYAKVTSQWNTLLKKGRTAKGIFFAVKYYYETQKGDIDKSEGGIGIVQHIYDDSCAYWVQREAKEKGICASIEKQIIKQAEQKVIVVKQKDKTKKKDKGFVDWSVIASAEEDEC